MGTYRCPRCKKLFQKEERHLMCSECGFQLSTFKMERRIDALARMNRLKPLMVLGAVFAISAAAAIVGAIKGGDIAVSIKSEEGLHLPAIGVKTAKAEDEASTFYDRRAKSSQVGKFCEDDGVIFYDKRRYSKGWRFLAVSPTALPSAGWQTEIKSNGYLILRTGLGEGDWNTYRLISCYREKCAARAATSYGTTEDWYLGNFAEMSALRSACAENKRFKDAVSSMANFEPLIGNDSGSASPSDFYWTSEIIVKQSNAARAANMRDGSLSRAMDSATKCHIRPIRKF